MTIFLDVVTIDVQTLEPIRSSATNRVIAHKGIEGIYLWDRLSSNRHVLTWESIKNYLAEVERDQHKQAV